MLTFNLLGRHGRMGNQMYQYAFLRAAAERTGLEARIPARCVRWTGQRSDLVENGLAGFRIEAETYEGEARPRQRYVEPEDSRFNPRILHPDDGTDFLGYYQDHRYFADAEASLRREFRFLPEIEDRAHAVVDAWRDGGRPIVSVTVRRGDYLQDHHLPYFRVFTAPELEAAMATFGGAIFAIGSDDLDWCRRHFAGDRFREIPQDCSWTAMAVASLCDHHIISASTFCWWGAWLGSAPGKRVLYPDPWYKEPAWEVCCPSTYRHPAAWEPLPTDKPSSRYRIECDR